jgi:hypothetical protein
VFVPRPYRPRRELEGHLSRGELDFAIAIAKGIPHESGRPLGLDLALLFLPVIAMQRPEAYDQWALRWLARWSTETTGATIDQAAEVAGALVDLPMEPQAALGMIEAHGVRKPRTAASAPSDATASRRI